MAESAHPPVCLEKIRQKLFELEDCLNKIAGLSASLWVVSNEHILKLGDNDHRGKSFAYLVDCLCDSNRDLQTWHGEALDIYRHCKGFSVETDPHPRLFQEWLVLEETFAKGYCDLNSNEPTADKVETLSDTCDRLRMDIANTPVKTPAGAAVQLRLMHNLYFEGGSTHDEIFRKCLDSVIAFLAERSG